MTPLFPLDELGDGAVRRCEVDGRAIAVVRIGDAVHAIDDQCSHAAVSLSDGDVWPDACTLECPKHGSAFSLVTGEPDTLPATRAVAVHRVEITDGVVTVEVRP